MGVHVYLHFTEKETKFFLVCPEKSANSGSTELGRPGQTFAYQAYLCQLSL